MTKILHIIGEQGVGKSTLAHDIKTAHAARGIVCENLTEVGVHEPGMATDIDRFRDAAFWAQCDVLIVEHLDEPLPKQVRAGDLIIRMERAK